MRPISSHLLEAVVVLSILHNSGKAVFNSGAAVGVASRADHLDINSTKLWSHSSRSSELPFSSNDDGGEATAETVKLSPKVFEVAAAVEEAAAEQREDDEEEKGELAVRSARAVASQDWRDAFKCGGDTRRKTESVSSEREITYSADATPPSPTQLQMEHLSLGAVVLQWDYHDNNNNNNNNNNAATSTDKQTESPVLFLVQCSRDRSEFANASDLLNTTEYVFDMLCQAAVYQFQVLAYNGGVFSKPSPPTYTFISGVTAPAGPPTEVAVLVLSPHSVQLSWEPPSPSPFGSLVYYIYWGEDPARFDEGDREVVFGTTHYTLDSLLPAHTYYFSLMADVSSHYSTLSPVKSATTPADLPPVTILNATLSSSWILLTWSDPPDDRHPTTVDNFTVLYAKVSQVPYPERDNMSLYLSFVLPNGTREVNVTGLVGGTEYVFRVFYTSNGGYTSNWSEAKVLRTLDSLVCSVCTAINSTALRVMWETSLTRNHVLQTVTIFAQKQLVVATLQTSTTTDSYLIGRLHPWTEYVFTVAIGNSNSPAHLVSECPAENCITKEDVPSQPPVNFEVTASTSRSMTLEWDPPPPADQNGVVTQYFLAYTCTTQTSWRDCSDLIPRVVPASGSQLHMVFEVSDLIPYTEYWFQIAAETHTGKGPTTQLLHNTTQDAPVQSPRNVTIQSVGTTTVRLMWNPPDPRNRNGPIIGYTVIYRVDTDGARSVVWNRDSLEYRSLCRQSRPARRRFLSSRKRFTSSNAENKVSVVSSEVELMGLRPETSYVVSIAAKTEIGEEGPYSKPLAVHTNRSDIFATLAAINLSVRELKFAGSDNCFFPAAKWNNLSELIDSFALSGYDDITGTAASPINYTLVFSDQRDRECWTTQLNATTNSYNVTHKQSNCGKTFFLHLQIEALLQNGSHLHITSPLVHSSATNCTGGGSNDSSSVWETILGVSGSGVVATTATLTLCFCLLRLRRRNRSTGAATSAVVLMDTYQADESLDESVHISSALRVGDGAMIVRPSTTPEESRTPSPYDENAERSMMAASLKEGDESSLGSSVADEESPLLGQELPSGDGEMRNESCGTLFSALLRYPRSSSPVSLLERPTELPLLPLSRLPPEGQSFSSASPPSSPSTTSSSPPHSPSPSETSINITPAAAD